ncbi:hypothetical protein IT409_00825 [Candidatus Falkowbacteria bacterium]|nr:hypothetical protein [Candidatus Falkowbacteria bacterium]
MTTALTVLAVAFGVVFAGGIGFRILIIRVRTLIPYDDEVVLEFPS